MFLNGTNALGEKKNTRYDLQEFSATEKTTLPVYWVYISKLVHTTQKSINIQLEDTHRTQKGPIGFQVRLRVNNVSSGSPINFIKDDDILGYSETPFPNSVEPGSIVELSHGLQVNTTISKATMDWFIPSPYKISLVRFRSIWMLKCIS